MHPTFHLIADSYSVTHIIKREQATSDLSRNSIPTAILAVKPSGNSYLHYLDQIVLAELMNQGHETNNNALNGKDRIMES